MALLQRRRPPTVVEDSRMSVIEHLEALRRALIVCMIAWFATTVISFFFAGRILNVLIDRSGVPHQVVYYNTVGGGLFLVLKVALYMGVVFAAPVIIQQTWWFVSPGLHPHERRLIVPLIVATTVFFFIGICFAVFALPLFVHILGNFAPADVQPLIFGDELIGFVLMLIIGFGIVFELPVALYSLGLLGIINSRWLYKHRGYWLIGMGVLANVLTPGVDPLTPMLMFVPLWIFWEGTALLLKLSGR